MLLLPYLCVVGIIGDIVVAESNVVILSNKAEQTTGNVAIINNKYFLVSYAEFIGVYPRDDSQYIADIYDTNGTKMNNESISMLPANPMRNGHDGYNDQYAFYPVQAQCLNGNNTILFAAIVWDYGANGATLNLYRTIYTESYTLSNNSFLNMSEITTYPPEKDRIHFPNNWVYRPMSACLRNMDNFVFLFFNSTAKPPPTKECDYINFISQSGQSLIDNKYILEPIIENNEPNLIVASMISDRFMVINDFMTAWIYKYDANNYQSTQLLFGDISLTNFTFTNTYCAISLSIGYYAVLYNAQVWVTDWVLSHWITIINDNGYIMLPPSGILISDANMTIEMYAMSQVPSLNDPQNTVYILAVYMIGGYSIASNIVADLYRVTIIDEQHCEYDTIQHKIMIYDQPISPYQMSVNIVRNDTNTANAMVVWDNGKARERNTLFGRVITLEIN